MVTDDINSFRADDTIDPLSVPFSWQNEVGYSTSGAVFIPRDESLPLLDVLGAPLAFEGRVRYDLGLVSSSCITMNGTTEYISVADLVGTETVTSSGGTSTPSISAGRIDFTAGTCWDLRLSSGHIFPLSEETGTTVYNIGTGNDGTINTADIVTVRGANVQDEYHHNILYGFRMTGGVLVPALLDKSLAADGNPITHVAGEWHNDAETKLSMPVAPALAPHRSAIITYGPDPDEFHMSELATNISNLVLHKRETLSV